MRFKDGETVEAGAVVKALNDMDDQLGSLVGESGSVTKIAATLADIEKRVDDAMRRDANGGKSAGSRFPGLSADQRKALSFEVLHKFPSETSKALQLKRSTGEMPKRFMVEPNEEDFAGQWQKNADDLYIFGAYAGFILRDASEQTAGRLSPSITSTKYYRETYLPRQLALLETMRKEGFDTATAGEGLELVPTDHSNRLFDLVELEPGLADYFETIPMSRGKQDFPAWLDNFLMELMPERLLDGYNASTDGRAPDMLGAKNMTGLVTFEAVKFGGIVFFSKEVEEDSIVALLPLLNRKIVKGAKRTQDVSMVSGQKTASIDTDVAAASATDARKAYDGLRYDAVNGAAITNAAGNTITTDAAWNDYVREAKGLMGPYGVYKNRLIRLWSTIGENQIGSIPKFAIISAFGDSASVRGGDATTGVRRDGIEDVISEFMPDTLATSGKNEAAGNDYTSALIVSRDAWATGVRREIRLEMSKERWFEYDLDAIKVTMRRHFKRVLSVGTPTALIRAIGK